MKKWVEIVRKSSMYYRLLLIAGGAMVLCLVMGVGLAVSHMQDRFIDIYARESQLLLQTVSSRYESLYQSAVEVLDICPSSKACEAYFSQTGQESPADQFGIQYNMGQLFKNTTLLYPDTESALLLVSETGSTFLNKDHVKRQLSPSLIWQLPVVQQAQSNPMSIVIGYSAEPALSQTGDTGSVILSRVWENPADGQKIAALLFISAQEFGAYYDAVFDSRINSVCILAENGEILSSNVPDLTGTLLETDPQSLYASSRFAFGQASGQQKTLLIEEMPFLQAFLVTEINHTVFQASVINWPSLLAAAGAAFVCAALLLYYQLHKATIPLRRLQENMKEVARGNFSRPVPVEGHGEIADLASTYNTMLRDLDAHVQEVLQLEEQKRLIEIQALQQQINPHFIYNTLTSFKFLVWQKKDQQLLQSLDAFIGLLRNTLSKTRKLIPVKEEMENLKNYVQILQVRFGENISVQYSFSSETKECLVPNLILQPFVENAFFHAFPGGGKGMIHVFGQIQNNDLVFEIVDNGCGMTKEDTVREPFSGIGIRNVNERIQLLFGKEYGLDIHSVLDEGTMVTLRLPAVK